MTSSPSLNSYTPHRWARVVSGETWAEYGLGPSGQVEAKTLRGPLIVWATKPGEGEDLPRLEAPTPSPLEVEAARLNSKAHFLAFVRFAQGRRKTKTGRRVGFLRLWRGAGRKARQRVTRDALRDLAYTALLLRRAAEGKRGIVGRAAGRSRRRDAVTAWQEERVSDRLRRLAPSHAAPDGIDLERLEDLRDAYEDAKQICESFAEVRRDFGEESFVGLNAKDRARLGEGLRYALAVGDLDAVAVIFANAKARRAFQRVYRQAVALRALEAAAYRAHVTRRVRPPARRARIPRPIYARPRPPTAPLAPPVTC